MSVFCQKANIFATILIVATLWCCADSVAQRPRFPDLFANQQGNLSSQPGTVFQPPAVLQAPNFQNGQPIIRGPIIQPGAIFQGNQPAQFPPVFNPGQTPNQPFPIFPRLQNNQPAIGSGIGQGGIGFPALPNPQVQNPNYLPQRPPYQGTGNNWLPSIDWTWPRQTWHRIQTEFLPRLFERPRARQTYLQGSNGNELNINDLELATTLTYPNFLRGTQPLRVSPGFMFHWWNGPDSNSFPQFDLPSRAYSAYLAFDHVTDPRNATGFENNLTVGYYSDFNNTSSDAIRLTGKLLGWYRLNEYTVGKIGVEYLDRVDVKVLPAFGFYMTPNPDMKFDLYFPRPKLSHRVPNFGDLEAWVYVGGEYGGGSWAIERRDGSTDQVDINDVRAFLGVEWMGPRRVTGFFEFGYAFDREILYRSNALNILDIQDTLMLRSGFAF